MASHADDITPGTPQPAERVPPFLLAAAGAGLVLIAPFPKRAHGLTPAEVALVQAVAGHLRNRSTAPDGPCWIDASTGSTTPAAIGDGQLRRRLIDNARFNVT